MPAEPITATPPGTVEVGGPRERGAARGPVWAARLQPFWPAAVASAILLILAAVFVHRSIVGNAGHLVYPLDDAYSHMAIAKSLLRRGIWGFSVLDGFSSGGSSLIWPLLLAACFAIFGIHEWAPLALNLLPAVGFFFYAGMMIRRHTRSGVVSLLILLAVMYFTPLTTLACSGMEHCWQILVCLVFLELAAVTLSDDEPPEARERARRFLPALAFMMTMVRYEGLFLLGIVGLLLLYRRQWQTAILCGVAGGFPIAAFGMYAKSKGWHFLPNSLLLKASVSPLQSWDAFIGFVTKWYAATVANPHMYVLLIGLVGALVVQWRRHDSPWNRLTLLLVALLGGTLIHLQFAGLGWFYRYEAYLLGLGILAISLALVDEASGALAGRRDRFGRGTQLVALALAAVLFCAPLWTRAANAWAELPRASHNIYEQQFQMAHFVRQFYRGKGVAANDIGAIDFYSDIALVDLWGLGTMEVTEAKLAHDYSQDTVRRLLARHDVRLILVYEPWSVEYGGTPAEWVPVGQWTITDNVVCGWPTVSFYAPNATMVPQLLEALRAYSAQLPPNVVQTGFYRGQPLPHVQGAYPPEKDGGGTFYWTARAAQFALYPSDERTDAADVDAVLALTTRSLSKGVSMDVTLNGRVIASRSFSADDVGKWVEWHPKVHWREGDNVLNIMTHGGQTVSPAGDGRPLLFAIHEPKWTFDDAPDQEYPLPVTDLP